MKSVPLLIFLFLSIKACPLQAQVRCAAVETRQQMLAENSSGQIEKTKMENAISEWVNLNNDRVGQRSVVPIPIVVHVVYNNPIENISDEQIISQIEILNKDYQAMNVEIPSVPAVFQPLIANVAFEFCLALIDPDGNPTTGITRRFTNNPVGIGGTSAIHHTAQGGQDAWDTEHYLNIWVAKFAGGIGGVASFPGIGPPAEDGVEINYKQFGNINVEPPYHLGRTLTHEIGHYFNLEHPWGPALNDCCEDDFVVDTPKACETYIGECPTHPSVSCNMPDMFMNFMFYTNDECMAMFSAGQKLRMLATLNTVRAGLLDSKVCDPVEVKESGLGEQLKILSNPVRGQILFETNSLVYIKSSVKLLDASGQIVFQKSIDKSGTQKIEVGGFPSGVYFLIFENNNKRDVRKLVVLP